MSAGVFGETGRVGVQGTLCGGVSGPLTNPRLAAGISVPTCSPTSLPEVPLHPDWGTKETRLINLLMYAETKFKRTNIRVRTEK